MSWLAMGVYLGSGYGYMIVDVLTETAVDGNEDDGASPDQCRHPPPLVMGVWGQLTHLLQPFPDLSESAAGVAATFLDAHYDEMRSPLDALTA